MEGGCGNDLYTIVEHAPNIHTLHLISYFKTAEWIAGLRNALPVTRSEKPHHHPAGNHPNKAVTEAKALLNSCIADSRTSLKFVALNEYYDAKPEIVTALSKAPALEELIIDTKWEPRRWQGRPDKEKSSRRCGTQGSRSAL
ncbi:uncharacterized protein PHACADRAFT_214196 [Phanerochaete carnosa HHB-10118-sp]|uniref:Uncharacterized protein n=1 Tax=Phanerochaete carnosa (strain HHB-10118-sp) TaxID=650164 RepID=K5VSX2_PHACS|nr:uncharacterized protein PHACADRAFT_214196 [Phanerochaete carnosa HHB-10118-sp]EKM49674.1 hypothetical protein PHACADRAFT_214196 [Phanerochaete carnosa HHB-10118-sp]